MLDNFGIRDIIDVILVAVLMYQLFNLVKRSGTTTLFNGILAFIILWIFVSQIFQMRLLGSILDMFGNVGLFVIIILFQDEIRRFLMNLGSNRTFNTIAKFFGVKKQASIKEDSITALVLACMNMAKTKTGALIVIEQEIGLGMYESTGEIINSTISTRLIENIFFKNSPLHDGAMIISKGKIEAAGCILPVSQKTDLPKSMGVRHRAALGIATETDAIAIVISEERGKISYAVQDKIYQNVTPETLQNILNAALRANKNRAANQTTSPTQPKDS
ncbi:diadenylate cyclase CdaA [Dysgonomonas sp. 520]|uniref:diadenylate cyclase CdaA n=1 Tax=Dysgonomonas sp. 520 TaxID=2302931 RepID=UPI0013D3D85A|nr:diadenylate cyclase CdaA [Dysgonomonas sp. 520]NDW09435.1 TIGR00159 family protein [Dysgonomonas sp. 520]